MQLNCLFALLALVYGVECQTLQKKAEVFNSSDPVIVGINFQLDVPVEIPNANLTETINPSLEIKAAQRPDGAAVEISADIGEIFAVFNDTIPANETFFSYNVTLENIEGDSSVRITLTSTFTYFYTAANGTILTNSSEDTICIQRSLTLFSVEQSRQWYIAIVLIVCIIFGFLVSLLVLLLLQRCSLSSHTGHAAAAKRKDVEEKGSLENSSFSANEWDFSHAIASDDSTESSRILELCEISDISSAEAQLQCRKASLMSAIQESEAFKKANTFEEKKINLPSQRKEIQKATEQASKESQIEKQRISDSNQEHISSVKRNQENEIEKLKAQLATVSPEVQDEILSLANERHKLEIKEEEHISCLKVKEVERKARTIYDIKCNIVSGKLDVLFDQEASSHPQAIKDAYSLLLERSSQIMEQTGVQSLSVTSWRKKEDAKIRAYELSIRGKWNRYAQAMVDAVKTICRELQLESQFRKSVTSFIREEMRSIKVFFDEMMKKERADYLRICSKEKPNFTPRGRTEVMKNPIPWMEESMGNVEKEITKMNERQREYDVHVVDLWNKKFQAILKVTAEKMTTLKDGVVQKLAQNGASRRSVEEFITMETKENTIEVSQETQPANSDIQVSEDKAKAREVILQSHHKVLKTFLESQLFPTEKTSEKLKVNLKNVHHIQQTKQSLQRVRDYVHFHTESVKKKNKGTKQKWKKTTPKSEETIKKRLESQLEKWRGNDVSTAPSLSTESSIADFRNDMLSLEDNLSKAISSELSHQMMKKSKLELLQLDLNALERLMMTLLQSLVKERKLSPAECNTVLREHKIQTAELQKSSSLRTRRRLDQVVRKRLHSPPPKPFTKDDEYNDSARSQVLYHLNSSKKVAMNAIRKIQEDSEAGKDKFELLTQLNEQQALELRELDLKVIQALSKVAKVSSGEMKACLTLLLHHRDQNEIQNMVQVIFSGMKDEGGEKSDLLPTIREMIAQQKHRLAENILRTDEDFAPSPLRGTNRLQRIKQPHHVKFVDDPSLMQDRLSPLPDIRPEPVGRTSTPDYESVGETPVYSNFDQSSKPTRRRKKKSLKSLSVAR